MELLLTDDEVVALAMAASTHWPTGLPTVAVDQEAALLSSALRGRRSLAVRGLVGSEAPTDDVLEAVRQDVVGATGFVCLYVADGDFSRAEGSANFNAYPSGTGWLVETVSDIGVHQFSLLTDTDVRRLFLGLAQTAHKRGFADASSLCVEAVDTDGRSGICIERQAVKRRRVGGETVSMSDLEESDLGQEIDCILGRTPR